MRAEPPLVSVVIAHFRGDILLRCLASLRAAADARLEIIVVDDGIGDDGSVARARARFPGIRVLRTRGKRGYGAACNAGSRAARGEFVLFLNNDAEVTAGWLAPLLEAAERFPSVGFFQPKIVSMSEPGLFARGGGCGGGIDLLGYPFMRGSFVFSREADGGQYDAPADVFWANGAALFARASALERTGGFDEDFYMQMEDVDLGWRAQLMGIGVRTVPDSEVRHHGGWTLGDHTVERYYLSHRNSIVLLMKNAALPRALALVPARLAVEAAGALGAFAVMGNWRLMVGSLLGLAWIAAHLPGILRRRRSAQSRRSQPDGVVYRRIHRGSVLAAYLLRGVRAAYQLAEPPRELTPAPRSRSEAGITG